MKNSDIKFEAIFVSHYNDALEYIFKDYLLKNKESTHSLSPSALESTLSNIAGKQDSQIHLRKNNLI